MDRYYACFYILNYKQAPWKSLGFYRQMQSSAKVLCQTVEQDDKFGTLVWPDVCWDKQWLEPEQQTPECRGAWMKSLGDSKDTARKNEMMRRGEFFGFPKKMGPFLPYWTESAYKVICRC